MTTVPSVSPVLLRVDGAALAASDAAAVPLGRPLLARVEAPAGPGRWMVELAGRRFEARTAMALVEGAELEVVASRAGASLELRVLQSAARFDEVRYAAATLTQAGARPPSSTPFPPPDLVAQLAAARQSLGATTGGPAGTLLADAVVALSTPLTRGSTDSVAASLRRLVEDAGLLVEARLRAFLDAAPGGLTAGRRLPSSVLRDARVLLGALSREHLASDAGPVTAATDTLQRLSEAALARQLDLAAEWLHSGRLTFGVPMRFDDTVAVADLRVGPDDARAPGTDRARRGFTFDVRVELPDLGRLTAIVAWAGREITARVFVDRPALASVTRAELIPLADALRRAGFDRVTSDVVVDPVRATRLGESTAVAASGGAIIDARA